MVSGDATRLQIIRRGSGPAGGVPHEHGQESRTQSHQRQGDRRRRWPHPRRRRRPRNQHPRPPTRAVPKSAPAAAARPRPASKTAVYTRLAETTGLGRKDIAAVFAALGELIGRELGKKGPGQFVLPGLVKLKVVRKPATKARPGRNPHTGRTDDDQGAAGTNVVRAVPMKALKEMI